MLVLLAAVVTGAMAQTTYRVSVKSGTEDATSWQGKAGTGEYQALPLKGVAAGTAVSVKYSGWKLVKSVKATKKKVKPAAEATAEDKGKVIGIDGKIYYTKGDAEDAGTTAVAVIAYVGSETDHATYKHGLAIALGDEGSMIWSTAKSTCEGKTAITGAKWCLPSQNQWKQMFKANGGNEGSYTGLNTTITNAGGAILRWTDGYGPNSFWTSTGAGPGLAYSVTLNGYGGAGFGIDEDDNSPYVRACLAF